MGSRRNDTLQRPTHPFTLNRESEQARGLVAWWPMAPGGGLQCWDFSGFNYHCDLISNPTWTPNGPSFNGTNQYIDTPDNGAPNASGPLHFDDAETFTLSLWYQGTDTEQNSSLGKCLLGTNSDWVWGNFVLRSGFLEYIHFNGSWQHNIISTTTVADGKWHHLAYVNHANQTGDLYVDGKAEILGESSAFDNGSVRFTINSLMFGYSNKYTSGTINDVRVSRKDFTPAEVYRLWHPSTRFDLYYQPRRRKFFLPEVGDSPLGIANETDTSLPLTGQKRGDISFPSETDASQPLTAQKRGAVDIAAETDTSIQLAGQKRAAIGTAAETDESQAVTAQKRGAIDFPTETDDGLPLGNTLELVSEADAALPLSLVKRGLIGVAGETDDAVALGGTPIIAVAATPSIRRRRTDADSAIRRRKDECK